MVRRGLTVLAVVGVASALGLSTVAAAEPLPQFDGVMSFPSIQGLEGPEEFSWEVRLDEQELRQVDDRHAAVYYTESEHPSFTIEAVAAHDSLGTNVPTTLTVTQPNVITLAVLHRDGNPAAGGAPFDYPVIAGEGWEGGIQTHTVQGPQPTERAAPPAAPPARSCEVPRLKGLTLREVRVVLRRSNCTLGEVRGERARSARVVRQFPRPRSWLPAGARIDVKVRRGSGAFRGALVPARFPETRAPERE